MNNCSTGVEKHTIIRYVDPSGDIPKSIFGISVSFKVSPHLRYVGFSGTRNRAVHRQAFFSGGSYVYIG